MEHTFVLGFVGHNQAQLLVALPAQTLEHLLKPQQQLLERSLERIGRRDCPRSTNNSEEAVPDDEVVVGIVDATALVNVQKNHEPFA